MVDPQTCCRNRQRRMIVGMALAAATSVACGTHQTSTEVEPSEEEGTNAPVGMAVVDDLGMEFVLVEPGTFDMGSPSDEAGRYQNEKLHRVTLTKRYFIGTTEVTVAQFRQFIEATGYETTAEQQGWAAAWDPDAGSYRDLRGASWRSPGFERTDEHPVGVSWFDAVAFCDWLSEQSGATFRLPTEAEWEYACRAGGQTAFQWGDSLADGAGWCNGADLTALEVFPYWKKLSGDVFQWSDGHVFTAPVASFQANRWGVYDMHGNVSEWCADWFGEYPEGDVTDPQGPAEGTHRILRGGDWGSFASFCRSAHRFYAVPGSSGQSAGFRVVFEPGTNRRTESEGRRDPE